MIVEWYTFWSCEIHSEHKEEMKQLNKGSCQKKRGGHCCERSKAVRELTR